MNIMRAVLYHYSSVCADTAAFVILCIYRSTASNGRSKEEHIYDTVVLVKGGSLSSHYTTHTKLLSTPAEYEVPVNKHQVSKPITTQTNESYAVNPVSLAVFGNGQVPVTTTE